MSGRGPCVRLPGLLPVAVASCGLLSVVACGLLPVVVIAYVVACAIERDK
jgi:hypothetical protein